MHAKSSILAVFCKIWVFFYVILHVVSVLGNDMLEGVCALNKVSSWGEGSIGIKNKVSAKPNRFCGIKEWQPTRWSRGFYKNTANQKACHDAVVPYRYYIYVTNNNDVTNNNGDWWLRPCEYVFWNYNRFIINYAQIFKPCPSVYCGKLK